MKKLMRRLHDEESGQVIVLVAILMVGLVAVVGLVTDGGMVFTQRRDLQNVADAAALAGAMQIDQDAYRASAARRSCWTRRRPTRRRSEYLEAEGGLAYSVDVHPGGWRCRSRGGPPPASCGWSASTASISAPAPGRSRDTAWRRRQP